MEVASTEAGSSEMPLEVPGLDGCDCSSHAERNSIAESVTAMLGCSLSP